MPGLPLSQPKEADMAVRVSAAITIGGTMKAKLFADLVELITEAALSTERDGPVFEVSHHREGEALSLHAHEVAGGEFSQLEEFLVDHDLPFARWSGGYVGAFGAERVVFTGAGEPRSYASDEEDHVLIARDTVETLGSYEAVIAYFDEAEFLIPPLIVEG